MLYDPTLTGYRELSSAQRKGGMVIARGQGGRGRGELVLDRVDALVMEDEKNSGGGQW